jgi:hypothetical protein
MVNRSEPTTVDKLKLMTEWNVEFYPVEGKTFSGNFRVLKDLKESDDPVLRNFAGEIIYKADFELTDLNVNRISLGEVNDGVTEVIINGTSLGSKWYGLHEYEIDSGLRLGTNEIEIIYTSLLSNYCRSLEIVEAKRWIGNRDLISNGLVGPVIMQFTSCSFKNTH